MSRGEPGAVGQLCCRLDYNLPEPGGLPASSRHDDSNVSDRSKPSLPRLTLIMAVALAAPANALGAEKCVLARIAQLPVTMLGLVPTVHAKINGEDAVFIADSGAFFSSISHSAALHYQLALKYSPLTMSGVGGASHTYLTSVRTFTLFNIDLHNVDFLVVSNDFGEGTAGLLGQNVFRIADVDYDLGNGVIRLVRPQGDCKHSAMAYWATDRPYSQISIETATPRKPFTVGEVWVNGTRLTALFDTGAGTSMMTLDAAKRVGVTPSSPGVVATGALKGIGPQMHAAWIGPLASFKIGDEEIRNTRIRFADYDRAGADMLVGADFFLSHHVYVATSQRTLYLTYNGGPVFNLTATPAPPAIAGTPDAAPAATAQGDQAPTGTPPGEPAASAPPAPPASQPGEPVDASGYARRGAAESARHDYADAIADLTRACELDPKEGSYFYLRGMAYWSNHQPAMALTDIESSLKLKPEDVSALVARVELRAGRRDPQAELLADLDTASRVASREDSRRLQMGSLYEYLGKPEAAIAEYSQWIDTRKNDRDVLMGEALNARCRARALNNIELHGALDDCNDALRLNSSAGYYDSRGLVNLRLGNYAKSIDDYTRSLKMRPDAPKSLYGRGIAEIRSGHPAEGQVDLAAANAADPHVAAFAKRYGLIP
jgi:tetratricopeptide (TPR) repeat protein/predicted aspartyl protease